MIIVFITIEKGKPFDLNATKTAKKVLEELTPAGVPVKELQQATSLARIGNQMLKGRRPDHPKSIHTKLKEESFPKGMGRVRVRATTRVARREAS